MEASVLDCAAREAARGHVLSQFIHRLGSSAAEMQMARLGFGGRQTVDEKLVVILMTSPVRKSGHCLYWASFR